MAEVLPADREEAFWAGIDSARRFFRGEADVQRALERLARILDEKRIPYAVIGALALNEWGTGVSRWAWTCCSPPRGCVH